MEIKLGIISQKSKEEIKLENAKNFAEGKQKQARAETEISVNGKKITSGPVYDAAKAKLKIAGQNYKTAKAAYDAFITKKNEPKETEQKSEAERKAELDATALGETYVPGSIDSGFKGGSVGSGSTLSGTSVSGGFTGIAPNDIAKDIYAMSDADRKILAQNLKNAGYKVKVTGVYNDDLVAEYQSALSENQTRNITLGLKQGIEDFLTAKTIETSAMGTGTVPTVSVSDPTEAAGYVRSVFKSVLQRDPTSAEISKYSKALQTAEKKSPKKTVNGVTTGGLGNPLEFLTVEIQKLPEFAKKKTDKVALTSQSILGTAKANGVTLNQSQIDSFAKRVQDGTDIKIIDNEIRNIAGLGMPEKVQKLLAQGIDLDTVYSPYKNLMASILELNPESIDLKDPTLRSAFGPDKEIPIYDFEKNLRKDYRWQYTNNAREDVFQSVGKVLQDFGFQG